MANLSFQRRGDRRGLSAPRAAIVGLAVLALVRTLWLANPSPEVNVPAAIANIETAEDDGAAALAAEVRRLVAEISLVCPSAGRELEQGLKKGGTPGPPRQIQDLPSVFSMPVAHLPLSPDAVRVEGEGQSPPLSPPLSPLHRPRTGSIATQLVAHEAPVAQATITSIRAIRTPLRVAMSTPARSGSGGTGGGGNWLVDPNAWFVPEDSPALVPAEVAEEPPLVEEPIVPPAEEAESASDVDERPIAPPKPAEDGPEVVEVSPAKTRAPVVETPVVETPAVVEVIPPVVEAPIIALPPAPSPVPAPPQSPVPTLKPIQEPEPEPKPEPAKPASSFAPPPLGMPSVHSVEGAREKAAALGVAEGEDPHAELLAENCFPSARTCGKCHEKIYDEWSCSSHAYAQVSPMFHKFEQTITELSQGTVGYFCQRCHSPVGMSLNIPRDLPLWQQPEVAREGVTCIACHRVNQRYGKANGERRILPGDGNAPVYGPIGGAGVAEVIARKSEFKVKTSRDDKGPGQQIHREGRYFDQLSAAEYCTSCHQVAVHPGIKLEVVWEQYRASPARKRGVTCQDCHMGKVPGVASGYDCCAIAEVAGKKIDENRKHSNHNFYGPGYSIAHPGIFPFHLKAERWSIDEWIAFDWRAGWGTEEFEERLAGTPISGPPLPKTIFPKVWAEADDRYDARGIIDDNLEKLAGKTELRRQIMENGSHVDGPFFKNTPRVGQDLDLHYVVTNTNDGHNLPTGSLGAQPQLWANVVLIGPRGQRLWETGYTDQYGDVCDIHSRDVRAGRVPFDSQLFNLQTMFLITGATGTDREFFLPVNLDIDQLPFLRPGAIPISVTNHPPFIRMEGKSIAPLGKKKAKYRVPGHLLREPGRYRLSFRFRSRLEPIYFMDFVGATAEMDRAMNEGMIDVHPYSVEFDVR